MHHLPGWDSGTKEITRRFAAHGYNALCPNLYSREGSIRIPTTPRQPPARREESPTSSSWATPGRPRCVARPPDEQRQGRRHRLLLGRAARLPHGGEPARRRRGRLLRRVRGRHPAGGLPAQGHATRRPRGGARLPIARPLRPGRRVPEPRARRRTRTGAEGRGQEVRVPPIRRRRARVLHRRSHGVPSRGRRRRMAARLRLVRRYLAAG